MARFPADSDSRRTDTRACGIVHHTINAEHWDFRSEGGHDFGRYCILELSEDNYWKNHRIQVQIKGTKDANKLKLKDGNHISRQLETKTIGYGLNTTEAFVLMVVDTTTETIYYQELHDYFASDPELLRKIDTQSTISIRIPTSNTFSQQNDEDLQQLAKRSFDPLDY